MAATAAAEARRVAATLEAPSALQTAQAAGATISLALPAFHSKAVKVALLRVALSYLALMNVFSSALSLVVAFALVALVSWQVLPAAISVVMLSSVDAETSAATTAA